MENNSVRALFAHQKKVCSIYLPAGYPKKESTVKLIKTLAESGVSLIELGMPFSDSIVDGPLIQEASTTSLENGTTLALIFEQLQEVRKDCSVEIVLMGSINPVLQYGIERFCKDCKEARVAGCILPDLPVELYEKEYKKYFDQYGVGITFLVTSETPKERVKRLADASSTFLYVVSSPGVTGGALTVDESRKRYLEFLKELQLSAPLVVGFGVRNRSQVEEVLEYADGVIIGTEYLRRIKEAKEVISATKNFVQEVFPR